MAETFLSDLQIAARYNAHKSTPWRWASDPQNDFPKPVKLSPGCTRWKLSELEAWEARKQSDAA